MNVRLPNAVRNRIKDLTQENFALWIIIAENGLYAEANDFLSGEAYSRISDRSMFYDEECIDYPYDSDLPF